MKTALLSVYNKEGIVEFAKQLVDLGFKIIASGGTAKILSENKIEVTDTATLVGGAILGHRVVTLSREIHAGLLARDIDEDRKELERLKIPWIDLVCVDLYPLTEEIEKLGHAERGPAPRENLEISPEEARDSVIEKTDIGGPTMLRSGAKGRRIVISDPEDRPKVIEWLKNGEQDRENFINKYCAKAEFTVSNYALASARFHSQGNIDGVVAHEVLGLKYGENAWQVPAGLFKNEINDELSICNFKLVAGTAPSYNNLADVDRLMQTITHIAAGMDVNGFKGGKGEEREKGAPCIAVGVKHGNPCGAAVGESPPDVIKKMLEGDPRAIFGGVVMVNFKIDEELAEVLLTHKMAPTPSRPDRPDSPLTGGDKVQRRLLDGIVAPEFTQGAIEAMKRKGDKCRFLTNPKLSSLDKNSLDRHPRFRYVRGGFLKQPNYSFVLDLSDTNNANDTRMTRKDTADMETLSDQQKRDIILAWAVGSTSNSNTVTIVKDGMLLGNGVGQQDRVGCCELAIKRATDAGHKTEGATAYSDSFFPFVDGPQTLAEAGIRTIFATSGSVRDEEVARFCKEKNIVLVTVPDSQARGFFGH